LVKIGKFPIALGENETIANKVAEVKGTVRYFHVINVKIPIEEDFGFGNSFRN